MEYGDLFLAFAAGFVVAAVIIFALAKYYSPKTKARFENPLTMAQKRRIREFAKDETGHDFLWGRDGKLAIWR